MDPIIEFMHHNKLLEDKIVAHKLQVNGAHFWILDEKLVQQVLLGLYMSCVYSSLMEDVLFEIREGVCKLHSGGRLLA